MVHKYYLLPPMEISYLRFLLESYDGLAFARTLDPATGLVEIGFPASREPDALALLHALEEDIHLVETEPPAEIPPI